MRLFPGQKPTFSPFVVDYDRTGFMTDKTHKMRYLEYIFIHHGYAVKFSSDIVMLCAASLRVRWRESRENIQLTEVLKCWSNT